jgi:hypothetical protein
VAETAEQFVDVLFGKANAREYSVRDPKKGSAFFSEPYSDVRGGILNEGIDVSFVEITIARVLHQYIDLHGSGCRPSLLCEMGSNELKVRVQGGARQFGVPNTSTRDEWAMGVASHGHEQPDYGDPLRCAPLAAMSAASMEVEPELHNAADVAAFGVEREGMSGANGDNAGQATDWQPRDAAAGPGMYSRMVGRLV